MEQENIIRGKEEYIFYKGYIDVQNIIGKAHGSISESKNCIFLQTFL